MSRELEADSKIYFSPSLRKVLLSALLGAFAYVITNLTDQPQLWQITVSIFISGVLLVVQFVIEFDDRLKDVEHRQHSHHKVMEQLVDQGFRKISDATELFGLVEMSAVKTDSVTQLVRNSTRIDGATPELVQRFAQGEINRLSQLLLKLGDGSDVTYEGEDREWILGLARNAESFIYATSLTTVDAGGDGFDGGFWNSDLGQHYLELQREAIQQRNVTIKRLFILDRPTLSDDPDFQEMCVYQSYIGIEVRVLKPRAGPSQPPISMSDFILFDGVVSYETIPAVRVSDRTRPTIMHTRLVLESDRLKERTDRFADLWGMAVPFRADPNPELG
ncbi:hypothetical protein GCM10010151_57370 [Actinoallomurus spadix]|uniref:Uncharacterized protein n=1 Tax=Actinoallomurus spadix TaxID=79912 RepID=A0ABN0XBH0_9ACTN